jgi:hypothetical protein
LYKERAGRVYRVHKKKQTECTQIEGSQSVYKDRADRIYALRGWQSVHCTRRGADRMYPRRKQTECV